MGLSLFIVFRLQRAFPTCKIRGIFYLRKKCLSITFAIIISIPIVLMFPLGTPYNC